MVAFPHPATTPPCIVSPKVEGSKPSSPFSMASSYFSHHTSPDDSDIDAIISEAGDLCVLEQIAAINTAHLSAADLPAELESRFRELKTFPVATQRRTLPPHSPGKKKSEEAQPEISSTASPKPEPGAPPDARRSPSPTPVICCFGCSPKKMVRRRKVKSEDEIFMGFGAEKMKEQRRKLEKVLREQEKASVEAEKMVEMFEAAAARLNAEAFDELMVGNVMEKFK